MGKLIIEKHILIPKHSKLSDKEKEQLFQKYNISFLQLPKIDKKDPAIAQLKLKQGDVVKIVRKAQHGGDSIFYRGVIRE